MQRYSTNAAENESAEMFGSNSVSLASVCLDMSLQCDVDPWSRLPDSDTVGNSRNHSLNCGGRDNTLTMCSLPCRWAQPGQYLAPWATHDGMSVAKWIEQWRTLATKFTSLLEQ